MLLKDRVCTFEEVQDKARALLDDFIRKYSVGTRQQVFFICFQCCMFLL
jgi:hypothetical protein